LTKLELPPPSPAHSPPASPPASPPLSPPYSPLPALDADPSALDEFDDIGKKEELEDITDG